MFVTKRENHIQKNKEPLWIIPHKSGLRIKQLPLQEQRERKDS